MSNIALEIARRIDGLTGEERRRIVAYVRAILAVAENEAELRRDLAIGAGTAQPDDYKLSVTRLLERAAAETARMLADGLPADEANLRVQDKLAGMSNDELLKYLQ